MFYVIYSGSTATHPAQLCPVIISINNVPLLLTCSSIDEALFRLEVLTVEVKGKYIT